MMQPSLFDELEIESGIPIPSSKVPHQRLEWARVRDLLDRNLSRLRIGESIRIPGDWMPGAELIKIQNYVSGAACSYRADHPGWAFTTRQMPDNSVRLWRIDPAEGKGRGQ